MHAIPRICSATLAAVVTLLSANTLLAQDTVFPAFGTARGAAFDFRAPAGQRIHAVHAREAAWIDALALEYGPRQLFGPTSMSSWVGSGTGGAPTYYTHDNGLLLRSIEVSIALGYINKMVFDFGTPQRLTWGATQANQTSHLFVIPAGQELIGLHGSATTALVASLGIVTRPRLGTYYYGGLGCAGPLGELGVRFASGQDEVRLGGTPTFELFHAPHDSLYSAFLLGATNESWNGINLPFSLGWSNCALWMSPDVVLPVTPNASGIAQQALPIPNDPVLLERWVYLGGLCLHPSFNPSGIITAGRTDIRIGAL